MEAEPFIIEEGDVLLIKPNALHGSHDCFGTQLEFRAVVFDYSFLSGMANDRIEQKYLNPLFQRNRDISYFCVKKILYRKLCLRCSIKHFLYLMKRKRAMKS